MDGVAARDVVALEGEEVAGGQALLRPVIVGGERVAPPDSLPEARQRCAEAIERLPMRLQSIEKVEPFPVELSAGLEALNRATAGVARSRPLARIEP